MPRFGFLLLAWIALATPAAAQNPIQWSGDLRGSVARAKRTLRPLLFHLSGRTRYREDELEDAQQRTFRDPAVRALVEQRFTPVRLMRTNETKKMLRDIGVPAWRHFNLIVVSPGGDLVGTIRREKALTPGTLSFELARQFRRYRADLLAETLKPKLVDEDCRAADVKWALGIIREFLIIEAEGYVIELLERPKLTGTLEREVYSTLAVLSTEKCVEALFERAPEDRAAAAALSRCTPGAAEHMLKWLDLEDTTRLELAYEAVTKICQIKRPRPKAFWKEPKKELKEQELERVRAAVHEAAARWREDTRHLR